jgi:hypothetical protein
MDLHFWGLSFGALVAIAILYSAVQKWKSRRSWRLDSSRQARGSSCMIKSVWGMNRKDRFE